MTTLGLHALPDRCSLGFAEIHHPQFCACDEMGEWAIFSRALRSVVRADGTVHVNDVRPLVRGRIPAKHIGGLWRRAKTLGLVRDTGRWEESTDERGRNSDKLARIYEWSAAA